MIGIGYIHTKKIVHGDIKPQNILIDNLGVIKVADFGISRDISKGIQKFDKLGGTVAYMAPEMLDN